MQERLKKIQNSTVVQIDGSFERPDPSLLIDQNFLDHVENFPPEYIEKEEVRRFFENLEDPAGEILKLTRHAKNQSMLIFLQVMQAVDEMTEDEGYYFISPVEHVKYCALSAMKVIRKMENTLKNIKPRGNDEPTQ